VKISIVIPAFNEEKLIAGTLLSIKNAGAAFAEIGWETELIVCNNNSTDRTGELAREAGATVVFEPVNQIGRARNTGAAAATGYWLLFVDADSHPSRELFADVARAIQSGRYLAGGSTVLLDKSHPVASQIARIWNLISRTGGYLAGSFIFCETSAFRELGGFDHRLYATEELELTRRLKKLARQRGRRLVILHRHPLVTSARKAHLYSPWEYIKFTSRMLVSWRSTLTDREACHPWYDGRR
jgi:glycosyltransferase involved in cell wall biosynthesis